MQPSSPPFFCSSAFNTVELTTKELSTLQDMLQTYREFTEDLYEDFDWNGEPETLFTPTQRQLFTRFDVISIKYTR